MEAISARTEKEEMIALYTTEELISPSLEYVLSNVSKKYSEGNYEVQFINMKLSKNIQKECYFDNINEIKELLTLIKEMVKKRKKLNKKYLDS